jgi:SPP1 gp7 family putative phage head morphogenesis protein
MCARKVRIVEKRKAWVDQFNVPIVKGKILHVSETIEARYAARLTKLIDRMTAETRRDVLASLRANDVPEHAVMDASPANQVQIVFNALMAKWEQAFGRIAADTARDMVDDVSKNNEKKLGESLRDLSGDITLDVSAISGDLRDVLDASVKENIALIKRVPSKYFEQMQGDVMRSIQNGNGLQDLIPAFEKREVAIRNWAQNVALDQTRKAFNGITRGRMISAGLDEFEWVHGGGSNHPREYHRDELNGNIYSLSEPPIIDKKTGERGIPGQLPYCRCTMRPVFRLPKGYHEDEE